MRQTNQTREKEKKADPFCIDFYIDQGKATPNIVQKESIEANQFEKCFSPWKNCIKPINQPTEYNSI